MKIIFKRTTNDHLITDNKKNTISSDEVNPENFENEMVGWIFQCSSYDKENDVLTLELFDSSEAEDYLEQLED